MSTERQSVISEKLLEELRQVAAVPARAPQFSIKIRPPEAREILSALAKPNGGTP